MKTIKVLDSATIYKLPANAQCGQIVVSAALTNRMNRDFRKLTYIYMLLPVWP